MEDNFEKACAVLQTALTALITLLMGTLLVYHTVAGHITFIPFILFVALLGLGLWMLKMSIKETRQAFGK